MREFLTLFWKVVLLVLITYAATKLFKPMKHADVFDLPPRLDTTLS